MSTTPVWSSRRGDRTDLGLVLAEAADRAPVTAVSARTEPAEAITAFALAALRAPG